jgi:radical SAM superfamily enzyme YgiQ (UPF0313 family)
MKMQNHQEHINIFRSLFKGREDVFAVRWEKGNKSGYMPAYFYDPYRLRAHRMNEAVILDLEASGCFRVWIGAESGSQKVIDLMDRRLDVNQVRNMVQLSQAHGIQEVL